MQTRTRKQGIVFVAALLAMLGMVLVGTSFVMMSMQQLRDARRDLDSLHAIAMADAGLNYFIWKQRFSGNPIATVHAAYTGDINTLVPTSSPTPQVSPSTLTFGEDTAAVWLFQYMPVGASSYSYQVVSRGFFRERSRLVRAVLQGPLSGGGSVDPPWMKYALFADSSMIISNSTDVSGDIASNGSITMDTSGGSNFTGSVRAATWVKFTKSSTSIEGNLLYGTNVYDRKGELLTTEDVNPFFTGDAARIPDDEPKTIQMDGLNPQLYADWAATYGSAAIYNASTLSDPAVVTTPILYVNAPKTANFTLTISTDLPGPLTIFVNGNVTLHGSVTLGTSTTPVAVIATGNVQMNGTPTINGLVWAGGTFNGGTPNVNGSIRCSVLGTFTGNPTLNWTQWSSTLIDPPDNSNQWKMGSWELL